MEEFRDNDRFDHDHQHETSFFSFVHKPKTFEMMIQENVNQS